MFLVLLAIVVEIRDLVWTCSSSESRRLMVTLYERKVLRAPGDSKPRVGDMRLSPTGGQDPGGRNDVLVAASLTPAEDIVGGVFTSLRGFQSLLSWGQMLISC